VPVIRLQALIEFRINRVDLSLSTVYAEARRDEKLSESIEPLLESIIRNIEEIVGVLQRGECIFHTTIILHEL